MTINTLQDLYNVSVAAFAMMLIGLIIIDIIRERFFTGKRVRKLQAERDAYWNRLQEIGAAISSPDSESGPCDMRLVKLEEPITGHTDCGRIGSAIPIRGNPDLKTCAIDQLMVEMGNRSVACIGVCYAEYLMPDGRVGRHPHIFYSGDPMMQLGMIDMLREFVRNDHVGDIIDYHQQQKESQDDEQNDGVPK